MIDFQVAAARPQEPVQGAAFHHYELDDGTVWTEFFRRADGYLLRFPDLADFAVSADGKSVVAYPVPDIDMPTVEHLYINQLMPLALSRQGQPAFHASVVTAADGAIAFLGKTQAGKSTLAASFALNGAAFLTDDSLLIEETDGRCWALPSHASIRLWDDSKEALLDREAPHAAPVSYSDKSRILAGDAVNYCAEKKPLVAAFVLQHGETESVTIDSLSGLDRYMGWLSNSFLLDIEDHDLLANHFEWTHRISDAVPTFALDYPRDYGILPAVRDTVTRYLET